MDSDSWARISTSARRYQFLSDSFSGEEDMDGEDGLREEFICPYCCEEFDIVGLCCHIDEQHKEARNGICPLCGEKEGTELVSHLTIEHATHLKVTGKRYFRKGAAFNILRRGLREENLLSRKYRGSSSLASTNAEVDTLLSSFIGNQSSAVSEQQTLVQPQSADEICFVDYASTAESSKRAVQRPPMSEKDLKEQERRSEFVRGLLMSTFLDDD